MMVEFPARRDPNSQWKHSHIPPQKLDRRKYKKMTRVSPRTRICIGKIPKFLPKSSIAKVEKKMMRELA